MKKIIYIVLALVINYSANAQGKINGIIDYNFVINNPDGTTFVRPYLLYFNNQFSNFVANGRAERIDNIDDLGVMETTGEMIQRKVIDSDSPRDYVYTDLKEKTMLFQEEIVREMFIVKEDVANIKWKLSKERKKIGKYSCQKAIGLFRGREYTVWFTTDIPVSFGPWKLGGLPGLILQVDEDRNKFSFRVAKLSVNVKTKEIEDGLISPMVDNMSTMDKYIEAIKNRQKNFEAMLLSTLPRGTQLKRDCDECPKAEDLSLEIFK
ncbi:GLPGLI family protein [Aquimarina algiphila]|uniref:GLPGLI family protein n=1 Tax=Aquimarina algiphila TaxID=2047982 RepID=A0A554VPT4_9FLAO|nr:GLPGLI family protein [Aquimarina algiphila]TSE10505.1 GLPGLI family protein [Aquimarina algiphila]